MNFTLRRVDSRDFTFLYTLHRDTLGPYVDQIWGWDEEWQRWHYEENYHPKYMQIIQVDGRDVGMVSIAEYEDYFNLRQIEILPEFQRRGLGSAVIHHLQAKCAAVGKGMTLRVFRVNPALRLYLKLGFQIEDMDEVHFNMRWDAKAGVG